MGRGLGTSVVSRNHNPPSRPFQAKNGDSSVKLRVSRSARVRGAWATDPAIENLRTWWLEGVTTSEIGRRLGATKCMIIGKAHRMELSARPQAGGRRRRPD